MSDIRTCPTCGAELPSDAPKGFCPRCLYRLGLEEDAAPSGLPAQAAPDDAPSALATSPGLPKNREYGDYELLEEIGHGGMGVVYKARQKSLDRMVALKMLLFGPHAPPESVKRFRAEAVATAALQHPNIVAIHEVGFCEGQHFIAMDYVEGQAMSALIRGSPLPARRAAGYVRTIAEAIHYAHERGILHRDLKPANVLIDVNDQPRVTDFGLARRLEGDSELTVTGQVLGSPNYMPPEQATAKRGTVSRRSDVYALGAILYHALTGRPPFVGEGLAETVQQVLNVEPMPPRVLNPGIAVDLETVCLKCLEKEPAKRYATAQLLAEELGRFLTAQPVLARAIGPAGKAWRWCRRNPRLASAMGVALLSLLIGLAGVSWQWRRAEAERARAEAERIRAETGELFARQHTYAADIHLAGLALANNNRLLALSLLDKHRPGGKSEMDLRGWEWRYLWELCRGGELFTLCRYRARIRTLAVSRDGQRLAIGTENVGELWDLARRQRLTKFGLGKISALAFSPTHDVLAVGIKTIAGQVEVGLWDVNAGKIAKTLKHKAEIGSLAFSPDGRLLATSDDKGSIQVFDWRSDQILTNLVASPRGKTVLAFSPDGRRLAIGEDFGRTRLFDLHSGTTVVLKTQLGIGGATLAFSPVEDLIAVGYTWQHRTILLCDSRTGEVRRKFTNHTAAVNGLVFTPNGRQLISASDDGTIRIWNVTDGTERRCLQSYREKLGALAMLPDGQTLVSGGSRGSVCLWDATATNRPPPHTQIRVSTDIEALGEVDPSGDMAGRPDPKAVCRLGVAFTPDSRRFITLDPDGALAIWRTHPAQLIEPLPALGSNHWGVALSPDGRWLATGECAGSITIWDWTARRAVTNFISPFEWVCVMRFSRSSHYLMSVDFNNQFATRARLWRTADWSEVPLNETQLTRLWKMDISPDDRFLGVAYTDGKVGVFRHPSGESEVIFTGHTEAVCGVHFSPDSRLLASASLDGSTRLWDVVAHRELTMAPLRGHPGEVWGVALSPDGRRLATGGDGPTDAVKLWDPMVQRELLTLVGDGRFFVLVDFSPDGNTIAATGMRGFANVWHAPSWEEIEAAEKTGVVP